MRTYVATYRIYKPIIKDELYSTRNVKYKFTPDGDTDNLICYLTLIANNRLQMRKLKKESFKKLKGLGKVELIVGVG